MTRAGACEGAGWGAAGQLFMDTRLQENRVAGRRGSAATVHEARICSGQGWRLDSMLGRRLRTKKQTGRGGGS